MAAGLGFKDFTTGEVLTAADVDGYLMQGIWVFADTTARDAAVTSPQEGNFAFLKDTNTTTYYTGSAWTNLDTTGMVNPMTTTGDTIYSSSGSTPARLGIGTAGQILQVNSGATAPEWATPAGGGGMTLLATLTLSGGTVTSSTFSSAYKQLFIYYKGVYLSSGQDVFMRLNEDTGSNYMYRNMVASDGAVNSYEGQSQTEWRFGGADTSSTDKNTANGFVTIMNPSDTNFVFGVNSHYRNGSSGTDLQNWNSTLLYDSSAAITKVSFVTGSSFSGGTAYVYGVN
jgi:hypothetical protein